ncbi:hypothetical protein CLOP_g14196 [Closterium sp. NIES-67]|nr:hypothetical protein CLOP_g14196 [Closterium sp. NIES-67]
MAGAESRPPPRRVHLQQQPLVVTTTVIQAAAVLIMYIMVSRHLSSIEQIAVALTESITEQASNQAHDMRVLVGALENHTYSVATAVTEHVAVQTGQLRQLASEVRNHSSTVQSHVATVMDAVGEGGGGKGGDDLSKDRLASIMAASARSQLSSS